MSLRSRRAFLASGVALATASLAGCAGRSRPDGTASTPTESPTATPTPTPQSPTTPDPTESLVESAYFVDPVRGSNENAGDSLDAPFRDLTPLTLDGDVGLRAGDVVYLRGGVYELEETVDLSFLDGTADDPIVVQAFPDERPVLDGSGMGSNGVSLFGSKHVHLRGFELRNVAQNGVVCSESNKGPAEACVFEDLEIHHYGRSDENNGNGMSFFGESFDHVVRRVTAHHGSSKSNSDGFYVGGEDGRFSGGHRFEQCVSYRNADDGFDFYRGDPKRGSLVVDSVAFRNGSDGAGTSGDGNGFKMGGGWKTGGNRCLRCVAYDNAAFGFDNNGASAANTYDNCTSFRNGTFGFSFTGNTEPDNVARNSLAYLNREGAISEWYNVEGENNSWDLDIEDPRFASTAVGEAFLHLARESPCVDAGVDIGEPFRGGAPDLGAFELA